MLIRMDVMLPPSLVWAGTTEDAASIHSSPASTSASPASGHLFASSRGRPDTTTSSDASRDSRCSMMHTEAITSGSPPDLGMRDADACLPPMFMPPSRRSFMLANITSGRANHVPTFDMWMVPDMCLSATSFCSEPNMVFSTKTLRPALLIRFSMPPSTPSRLNSICCTSCSGMPRRTSLLRYSSLFVSNRTEFTMSLIREPVMYDISYLWILFSTSFVIFSASSWGMFPSLTSDWTMRCFLNSSMDADDERTCSLPLSMNAFSSIFPASSSTSLPWFVML